MNIDAKILNKLNSLLKVLDTMAKWDLSQESGGGST